MHNDGETPIFIILSGEESVFEEGCTFKKLHILPSISQPSLCCNDKLVWEPSPYLIQATIPQGCHFHFRISKHVQ